MQRGIQSMDREGGWERRKTRNGHKRGRGGWRKTHKGGLTESVWCYYRKESGFVHRWVDTISQRIFSLSPLDFKGIPLALSGEMGPRDLTHTHTAPSSLSSPGAGGVQRPEWWGLRYTTHTLLNNMFAWHVSTFCNTVVLLLSNADGLTKIP